MALLLQLYFMPNFGMLIALPASLYKNSKPQYIYQDSKLLGTDVCFVKLVYTLFLGHLDRGACNVKFMFSKKATKIDKIFTVNLMVTTYCQIDSEDFVNFCGLLRK